MIWEYYTKKAVCLYKIDRASTSEVMFNSNKKVSMLNDQTLGKFNSNKNVLAQKPELSFDNDRLSKRYYLKFNSNQRMLCDINLNPQSGQPNITNIFIVSRLNSYNSNYWTLSGLFGNDNGQFYYSVSFLPTHDLAISRGGSVVTIGSTTCGRSVNHIAYHKYKAECGQLKTWNCLSIH